MKKAIVRLYKHILTCEADPALRTSVRNSLRKAKRMDLEENNDALVREMEAQQLRIKNKVWRPF